VRKVLPEKLSVLFVDDDLTRRKLFARAFRNIMPEWDVHEAANGETALRLADKQSYDTSTWLVLRSNFWGWKRHGRSVQRV
jgi:CheY-like chemotaxis protein